MSSAELDKGTNASSFVNLTIDDGSLTTPMAVGVGKANAGDVSMSDDEGRVITTLETAKSTQTSKDKVVIHSQTIIRPALAGCKVSDKPGKDASSAKKSEDLLAKMKSRLSKQIDLKLVTPSKPPQQSHVQSDTSGSIEIPHDLILSSDIPQTPLSAAASAKELEDHDLIAILEGDDVEITENATEIEVRVGRAEDGSYNDDQVLEEIQISFVDEQDIEKEQKEREKEIAMRQMASLPVLPKGRRPKKSQELAPPSVSKSPNEPSKPITIKGQTTIKPIPRPIVIKSEPVDESASPKKSTSIPKPATKVTPVAIHKARIMSPPSTTKPTTPAAKPSPKDIINSLVSDWDDEPVVPKEEKISPIKQSPSQTRVTPMAPPPIEELPKRSRIIKKKIIWDPDNPETHMSFASFVKSNRTKTQPEEAESRNASPVIMRPPGTGLRRKRAESVAVHMIKDTPYTPPSYLKRARTPEPENKNIRTNSIPKGPVIARKKKSEIEKLLGDEGAINMLYDVECENSNKDLLKDADINLDSDDEDEKLQAKAKIITDAVIKQGTSPNETTTHIPRVRTKRASTPQQTSVSPAPTVTTTTTTTTVRKSGGTSSGPGRKRKQNSASDDWDYVYSSRKTNDDAMIIRRRSNSSYSSSTSPRRLSVEQQAATNDTPAEPTESTSFEFVKPSNKPSPKPGNIKLDSSLVANMKGKLSKALGHKQNTIEALSVSIPASSSVREPPEKKAKISPKPKVTKSETVIKTETITTVKIENGNTSLSGESIQDKLDELKLKELSCKICGNYAEVILAPNETKLKDVFTVELINELKAVLNLLKGDTIIRAVLIRSSGKHFCRGVDVSYLIQPNAEKRKTAAQVFSGHLRNFLQTLATFNKPLVAAVHGDVLGLGVTMLPLFEIVIAPDNSTFSTPYAIFGHLPEAMKIFTTTKNLKPKAISDLLYLSKKISATTALDYGIVTDVVAPEKLQDRANSITKKLASLSLQAHKSMKINLRQELLNRLDDQLVSEQKKLSQQWITPECQEKFKQFVSRGGEW